MRITINDMINFIKDHYVEVVNCSADTITVVSVFTLNGVIGSEEVILPANMKAIREFLGY